MSRKYEDKRPTMGLKILNNFKGRPGPRRSDSSIPYPHLLHQRPVPGSREQMPTAGAFGYGEG